MPKSRWDMFLDIVIILMWFSAFGALVWGIQGLDWHQPPYDIHIPGNSPGGP